jgi:hypothetical protein
LRRLMKANCAVIDEQHIRAVDAANQPVFERLGLTDAAIAALVQRMKLTVITLDLDLWIHLSKHGVDAVNFNHVRSA